MQRTLVASIAIAFGVTAWAQAPAPAADDAAAKKAADRKAKQEMVQGTTEKAASQYSTTPNRGAAPASQKAAKPTSAQRKEVMQGANKSASSQYGPSAGEAANKVPKDAPKVAKPDMADPKIQEAMQKQKP